MFQDIAKCPVLKGLNTSELQHAFSGINFNVKTYEKNVIIMNSGEKCNFLMILIEGEVRGEMIDFAGNSIKIEDIPAPKPIASAFLFGQKNECPVTIISNVFSRILFIPKDEVIKLMQRNSQILMNYLDIISSRGQFLSQKIKLLSFKSLKQRIAYYLLKQEDDISVGKVKTQQEIAELLGVTRPALARTLGQMEKEGIILYKKGTIIILDRNGLSKLLV